MNNMKTCIKCNKEKDKHDFSKRKDSKDGLRNECKECRRQYNKQYHSENIEKSQQYYVDHLDHIQSYSKEYCRNHRSKRVKYATSYKKRRKIQDTFFAFKEDMRSLIFNTLKQAGYTKKSKTQQLLGCSYEEFLKYLGPKPEGNYHKDHICPCAQAQNEEEFIKLQHYTNFRWLTSTDNLKKSNNKTLEAEEMCRKLLGREWID